MKTSTLCQALADLVSRYFTLLREGGPAHLVERLKEEVSKLEGFLPLDSTLELDQSTCQQLVLNAKLDHSELGGDFTGVTFHRVRLQAEFLGTAIYVSGSDENGARSIVERKLLESLASQVSYATAAA